MPIILKCAECEKEGKAYSLSYGGVSPRTCMGFAPFVDNQGRRHFHDGNRGGGEYWKCSNGHTVLEEEGPSCWCGWPVSGQWAEEDRKKREDRERRIAAKR